MCLLQSAYRLIFFKNEYFCLLKMVIDKEFFIDSLTQSQRKIMCKTLKLLRLILLFKRIHLSLNFNSVGFLPQSKCFSHFKILSVESILWKFTLSSKKRTLLMTLKLITSIPLFQYLHVYLPVSITGLFCLERMFLPLEKACSLGVFF
jgi:hypothetical protein